MERVALCLSYIKGKSVDRWNSAQLDELLDKVEGQRGYLDTDENLWNEFVFDFRRAFANTTSQEEALEHLLRLEMKDGKLDDYITVFEELRTAAHWERDTQGTLNLFKQGLPVWLHRAVLRRPMLPHTLDDWIDGCREEMQRSALVKTSLGPAGGKGNVSTRRNLMKSYDPKITKGRKDPDAMDVDTLKTNSKLSKEEREKLSKEGRCFNCKKQGHMSRDCPNKETGNRKQAEKKKEEPKAPKVRTTVINEDEEDDGSTKVGSVAESRPASPDIDDAVKYVRRLRGEKRDQFMEVLACEGF
jgi:hypothetical protein